MRQTKKLPKSFSGPLFVKLALHKVDNIRRRAKGGEYKAESIRWTIKGGQYKADIIGRETAM